jgi:hypothetical protein
MQVASDTLKFQDMSYLWSGGLRFETGTAPFFCVFQWRFPALKISVNRLRATGTSLSIAQSKLILTLSGANLFLCANPVRLIEPSPGRILLGKTYAL